MASRLQEQVSVQHDHQIVVFAKQRAAAIHKDMKRLKQIHESSCMGKCIDHRAAFWEYVNMLDWIDAQLKQSWLCLDHSAAPAADNSQWDSMSRPEDHSTNNFGIILSHLMQVPMQLQLHAIHHVLKLPVQ